MTRRMSLPAILERIAQIDQIVSPKPPASTGGASGFLTALNSGIERGSSVRLNGLAALKIVLYDGIVVRVASLQGMGVLHQLAGRLASPTLAASGT